MVNRVTVVADRETFNLESFIDYSNVNPRELQLGGVLAPFNEIDMG